MSQLYDVQLKALSEFCQGIKTSFDRKHHEIRPSPSQSKSDWFRSLDRLLDQLIDPQGKLHKGYTERNSSAQIVRHQSGTPSSDHARNKRLHALRNRSTLSGYAARTETVLFDAHAMGHHQVSEAETQGSSHETHEEHPGPTSESQEQHEVAQATKILMDQGEQESHSSHERLSQLDRLAESFAPDALDEVFKDSIRPQSNAAPKTKTHSSELGFASQEDIRMVEEQALEDVSATVVEPLRQPGTSEIDSASSASDLFIAHIDEADIEEELDGIDFEEIT